MKNCCQFEAIYAWQNMNASIMEFTVAGGCVANLSIAHVFWRFGQLVIDGIVEISYHLVL